MTEKTTKRSFTRLVAAQIFYQFDFHEGKVSMAQLQENLLSDYFFDGEQKTGISCTKKISKSFLENLLTSLPLVKEEIDKKIVKSQVKQKEIEELPDMMRHILRLALFELLYVKDSPIKAIINEYVDLAASFYDDKKVASVNGILQKISDGI